jgi:orotidine-5'-phosphate decarboxylase
MTFTQKLDSIIKKNHSLVSVGLDSDIGKIPLQVRSKKSPQFSFNKAIIDTTAPYVSVFKPNSAFYEVRGKEGIEELKMTCDYVRETYPEIVLILDAKRADIGSTNEGYAGFVFDYLGADAVTIHPYLGADAVKPFLDRKEKGSFILCRTSNPGAGEFQDLPVDGDKPLYQVIAEKVAKDWNYNGNCGLVVGATYPHELATVRSLVGDMPLLIPGVGAQGGDIEKTVRAGVDSRGSGALINSSRNIIFASDSRDFAARASEETQKLRDAINGFR